MKIRFFFVLFSLMCGVVFAQESFLLEFRLVCGEPAPDCEEIFDPNTSAKLLINKYIVLSNIDVETIVVIDESSFLLQPEGTGSRLRIHFSESGKEKLAKVTSENIRSQLAILFRGQLLAAPVIAEPILEGEVEMTSPLAKEKAKEIASEITAMLEQK